RVAETGQAPRRSGSLASHLGGRIMVKHASVCLLLLLSSCSNVGISRLAQPSTNPQHTPTCQTAADLSYCGYPGSGPLLVLLTGLGNDMHSWPATFLQAINRFAGILTYDCRG